jgi:hypothetical protein
MTTKAEKKVRGKREAKGLTPVLDKPAPDNDLSEEEQAENVEQDEEEEEEMIVRNAVRGKRGARDIGDKEKQASSS